MKMFAFGAHINSKTALKCTQKVINTSSLNI